MAFKKRSISSSKKPSSSVRRDKKMGIKKTKKVSSKSFLRKLRKCIIYLLLGFVIIIGFSLVIVYKKIIEPLPSVSELENLEIAEASTIYDREGNELYSIFKEKRTYIGYDDISQKMVQAIVAGEDKRFFENPGVDIIGLFRAVLFRITGRNESLGGTSTLTQQLIRNTIIENRSSYESLSDGVERKIKEIYLAYRLTNNASKEKILELYLNKISFGSNAYGIEQASKTFFGKSAKDLGVLESSVLASLPKGPTYYSPHNNYGRVMGYPYIYNPDDEENVTQLITAEDIAPHTVSVDMLRNFLTGLKLKRFSESKALICGMEREKMKGYISVDSDGCSVLYYSELLSLLNGIKIRISNTEIIEYQAGRKDFILGRMLEDDYITFDQYKESLLTSFGYMFEEYRENIEHPHFVFFIREYLEEKYGKELIEQGGFQIYTSLDPDMQEQAEEIIQKYAETNANRFDAENAALVSIDNDTGEILAMVGGTDYFNQENKGNVNIITSRLQPGSTFKPFVYSLAIQNSTIGTQTPVYDLETEFPSDYVPNNFDGEFMGKLSITKALNFSRNIPAVKMFFFGGGERAVIDFMRRLGVNTLGDFKEEYYANYEKTYTYGASMALGTGLMTPLELAQAYSVYANMGYKKELVPIIKILDSKGIVVEEFVPEDDITGEKVLDENNAFIINSILSNTDSRPEFWNTYLSLAGRPVAAKTGTSTKQYKENGEDLIFPRNLWTVGYTPQITTVAWVGNTDGTELDYSANGLEGAGPIWRDFMEYAHRLKPAKNWERPTGVQEVAISKVSGNLAPDWYNRDLVVTSLFQNPPSVYDTNLQTLEVDMLCNGAVGPNTPAAAVKQVTLLAFHSLMPDDTDWEKSVQQWVAEGGYQEELGNIPNVVGSVSTEVCERPDVQSSIEIGTTTKDGTNLVVGSNYIEIAYRSTNPMQAIEIFLGPEKIKEIPLENIRQGVFRGEIFVPKGYDGRYTLMMRAVDRYYFSEKVSVQVRVIGRDPNPPVITMKNPIDSSIKLYQDDFFNLRGTVEDRGTIRSINIYIDDEPEKIGLTGREFTYPISGNLLTPGFHIIKIEAVDNDLKTGTAEVRLEILER